MNKDILYESIVDLKEDITTPVIAMEIKYFENNTIVSQRLFTMGNFSALVGKMKSKKTFLASMLMSAASSGTAIENKLVGKLPKEKKLCVYIDTEQSRFDAQKVGRQILKSGGDEENLKVFCLREFAPKERIQVIDFILEDMGHMTGLVVIDGIADLVHSINDEIEASQTVTKLMKWSTEYGLHIITLIHANKNDGYATGHIGSYVLKKCECVISLIKDEADYRISRVKHEMMRGAGHFPDFDIKILDGEPEIDDMKGLSSHYEDKAPF